MCDKQTFRDAHKIAKDDRKNKLSEQTNYRHPDYMKFLDDYVK